MIVGRTIAGAALAALLVANAAAETRMLGQPTLSAERLAFVYAGDIWIGNRDGSSSRQLTTSPADERGPLFSPDGTQIAFAGTYAGNTDVYIVSADGGSPRRLTWHPGNDIPTGWTPDGRSVAFVSARETDHGRSGQLYHVSVDGGFPVRQMQARFYRGSYDASGRRLAYIAFGSGYNGLFGGTAGWKGYRGGTTPAIMIMALDEARVTTVPGDGATNFNPFWLDDDLYFLSDPGGRHIQSLSLFRVRRCDHENQQRDRLGRPVGEWVTARRSSMRPAAC